MVVMRAKNPNPIIREIPATIRSIDVCTLIPIIFSVTKCYLDFSLCYGKMCLKKEVKKAFCFDTYCETTRAFSSVSDRTPRVYTDIHIDRDYIICDVSRVIWWVYVFLLK
ncbi:unnamed protein product [Brassica rapa]|uniref:Uncharacterized protein n=2 Tax=Brassica TaxID=3705 RepID=A0A8D9HGY9_BRACM|nr:unnamed protein product [Brassica napus]CAG7899323.1 unnamed protein product [Brassica rapa]